MEWVLQRQPFLLVLATQMLCANYLWGMDVPPWALQNEPEPAGFPGSRASAPQMARTSPWVKSLPS